jgi:hypothetical protein
MTEKIVSHAGRDGPNQKRGIMLLRAWIIAILIGAFAISPLQASSYAQANPSATLASASGEARCDPNAAPGDQHGEYCASVGGCLTCLPALPVTALAATLPFPLSEPPSSDGLHDSHLRAPPLEPPRAG